jgi:poly(A) polymerase
MSLIVDDVKNVAIDRFLADTLCRVYPLFDFSPPSAADALQIIRRLQSEGFTAYLAGGCVRDGLLGRVPKDFDVATDATPDTVRQIFGQRRTLAFGASFGVIGVQGKAPQPTEVATFRHDGTYSDGRRPDHVRFGTAEEDAQRRDYTINGLFYDPVDDQVIDFVDGRADLARRLVRAIGDPQQRIGEDKLRMLRAVRFAATLGFSIDPATAEAIRSCADEVTVTSGERIGAEMRRMLGTAGAAVALQLLAETHVLAAVWPELASGRDSAEQQRLLDTALKLAAAVQPPDFAACVAEIIAATAVNPDQTIAQLASLWKWSGEELKSVQQAVRYRETILSADSQRWSIVQPVLMLQHRETILAAAEAWALANGSPSAGVELCRHRLATWSRDRLDPPPLLTGDKLIELGHRPGRIFKEVLEAVRSLQLDEQINTVEQAVAVAEQMFAQQ